MTKEELINIFKNIDKKSCPDLMNFHSHTIFSDGSLKPEELLDEAFKKNLKYISITDHHTVGAHRYIKEKDLLKKYPSNAINLIPGIEINCLLKGCLVHVLGYGIDINSKFLNPYINGESPIGNDLQANSVSTAINKSGGLSFLAHPCRYRIPFDILIQEAFNNNFDGVEVWYDYSLGKTWNPSDYICEEVEKITNKFGMLKSCGTDSHGYTLVGR